MSATTVVINNRRLAATKFQGKLLPSTQPILRTLRIRTIHWQGGRVCRGVGDWKSGGSAPKTTVERRPSFSKWKKRRERKLPYANEKTGSGSRFSRFLCDRFF